MIYIFNLLLFFYLSGKGIGTGIMSRWTEIGGLKMTGGMREIGGRTMGVTDIPQRIPPPHRYMEIGGGIKIGRWRETGRGTMGRKGIWREI